MRLMHIETNFLWDYDENNGVDFVVVKANFDMRFDSPQTMPKKLFDIAKRTVVATESFMVLRFDLNREVLLILYEEWLDSRSTNELMLLWNNFDFVTQYNKKNGRRQEV